MLRPVRGMKDWYGNDARKYESIISISREICSKYGYRTIHTPIVEYTEIFQRAIGNETDVVSKEMYTFSDKGGDSLTLRPEGTAGVMRAIISESLTQNLPVRFMYYGEMFRYDRPQKGRFRQFHQLGCEYISDKSPYTDAIVIAMASEMLNALGIFDFKVVINSLGDDETREAYIKAIIKYFSRHEDELSDESKIRLKKNPLRILDSKNEKDKEICSMAPIIGDYFTKDSDTYFKKVCEAIEKYNISYEVNNFLVRGLDYYSHTAFEFKPTTGYEDSIGGGGRYDKLLEMLGGPNLSGVGFAFGIERIMLLLDDKSFKETARRVAVIPVSGKEDASAFELYRLLIASDIHCEFLHLGNIGKKMKMADKLNCELALIVGEDECSGDFVTIKYMNISDDSLKTKKINRSEVVKFVAHHMISNRS
ncbi:MAG: histidine--tRNA ligase [Holosporales bacterium]|jgi:histidyl-tRNA synthetase|nr:histidine--tRNA ligase [Holosporales bacterium]